ncbi:universal stress protein [Dyella sp. ASV21]|uniref:universal stress protein n=1 Tax=Dyella sp. ASV21 TaxID=2795114 RepID=UPI0018EC124C|nr:universal stress protein [Dyella sp. ASV21]
MNLNPGTPTDVLALVTSTTPWSAAAQVAAGLAATFQASLTGCFIDTSLRMLHGGEAEPSVLALLLDVPAESDDDRDAFASFGRQAGVSHARWVVTRAGIAPTLRQLSAWHDLVVIERGMVEESILFDVLGEALLMCRAPSLLLPSAWSGQSDFKRIVVAWNGSLESVRAIHSALPFLRRATEVWLIDGEAPAYEDEQERAPHFDPVIYLGDHGVQVRTHRLQVTNRDAGAALLREVSQHHADLLVMGAYGHSRVRERVLGGATRYVLEHAPLPILMQH